MRKQKGHGLVTARADVRVNQHAPRYADKRTKRNRDRAAQKRNAIREAS